MAELFGMEIEELDEGCVALEVVMSIKAIEENGDVRIYERTSPGLSEWEALGMAITLADGMRQSLMAPSLEDD